MSLSRLTSRAALFAALALAGASSAKASTIQWDGGAGDFLWGTGANWFDFTNAVNDVAPVAADDVQFGLGGAGIIDLGGNQTVNSLRFTLNGFTLGAAATANVLTVTSGAVTVDPSVTAAVNAVLNANNFTLGGGGTLVLNNAGDTLTGTTVVNSGILRITAATALGTANTINSGGTLEAAGITLDRSMTLNTGATLLGTGAVSASTGTMTITSGATVNINSGTAGQTFSLGNAANDITGGGAGTTINIGGSGVVNLVQANNVTANWKVNSGTLQINNIGTGSLGVAASTVTVESGASLITLPVANATINNAITLHGGTLNNNSAAGQLTIGATGLSVTADSTIRSIGPGTSGKIIVGAGLLTGTGNITKVGAGALTLTGVNAGYTGSYLVNEGVLEGGPGMLGSNLITVNGGELAATNGTLSNAVTVTAAGGAISSSSGNSTFSGPITLNGSLNVNLKDFFAATARNVTVTGSLSGSGAMNVLATAAAATLTLTGNNSAYTGAITIGNGTGTNPTLLARGVAALSGKDVTLNGGVLSLQSDGNGTASPQAVVFGDNITVAASSSVTVARAATEFAPLFLTAANKSLQLGTLAIGGQTLTVTNNNGYGLEFTGLTTLSAAPTFSVVTATGSNVVQGLVLTGKVTGGFGLTKAGAGTLTLGSASNDFTGNLNVTQGVLSFSNDGQLGAGANAIVLNPSTGVSTLRATDDVTTGRTIQFGATAATTRAIEVSGGKTLTLTSPLVVTGAETFALVKNDNGTLALTVANPGTWTGGVTINAGAVLVSNAGALGSTSAVVTISPSVAVVGAALQLAGNISFPNNINLQGNNNQISGGLNFGGQLQNVSGTNTTTGSILLNFDALIGADAGSTLNIAGGVNNPTATVRALALTASGTINLNSSLTAATATANQYFALQKYGAGTLNISTAQPLLFTTGSTQNLTFADGTTNFLGAGSLVGTPTIAATVSPGAKLVLDNSTQVVANRLGGRGLAILNGTFDYIGGSTASAETLGAFAINRGHEVITVTAGDGGANLAFGVPTRAGGSTALFRGTSLGTAAGASVATIASTTTGFTLVGAGGVGATNKGILPWALVDTSATGSGVSFATADAATGLLRPLGGTEASASITTGDNVLLSGAAAPGASASINSLTLSGGSSVTNTANSTLTVTSGGILALPGSSSISGGFLTQGTGELIIHTLGNLDISSTITGGLGAANFALTKAGAGTLTLSQASRHAGQTVVNQGTLSLNAGTNTIAAQNYLFVAKGATVNLNGTSQLVTDLFADATVPNNAGTVTGTAGSLIVLNRDNSARNWAGTITGGVGYVRSGLNTLSFYSDNTYTGPTILLAGTTTLRDRGALSATSRIDLNYGTLRIDNAVGMQLDVGNRVNDAAPVNLKGGILFFAGRAQAASRENLGALTLAGGVSEINLSAGGTGVNSADLSFTSLNETNNGATNFQTAAGALGSAARIFFGNGTSLMSNNILPAWIVKGGNDWASYNATQGVGAINDAGYAGYDGTVFPAAGVGTNQNIALAASGAVATGGQTLNTLNIRAGAFNVTFANATDVLNLGAGGLLKTGAAATFGATPDSGRLTAGGTASTGTVSLYLQTQTNGWTINSRIIDNPNGAAVRMVYVTYNGGNMTLAAPNTYSGGTVLEGWAGGTAGTLTLGATGVIPAGGLTIRNVNFAQVAGGVIHPSNVVTIGGANSATAGAIAFTGDNTLAGLVFDNDGGAVNPTVTTGGVLTLTGGLTATSMNVGSTPALNGTVDLAGNTATFNIAPITVETQNVAPFQPTMNIGAAIQNGGLTKTGNGVLGLSGVSTYSGATTVSTGALQFTAAGASLGNSTVTVGASGTLNLGGFNATVGGLAGSGNVVNATSGIPLAAVSSLTLGGNGASTTFSGLISGALALNKGGTGSFTLTNTGNTFSGGLNINSGTLILAGAGLTTTGTGLVSINNSGALSNAGVLPGGLALNPGSTASLALSGAAPVSTTSLTTGGPVTLNVTGSPSLGSFSLIDYSGTALTPAQFAGFRLGSNPGGGFLYGLVNNSGNTSVDVSVEALGAANTWTGSFDASWISNDSLNWNTAYVDGQRVTFNDSGANKSISGPSVAPQGITVNNSTGNDYAIDNAITGTLAAGLSKSGTGTLRLTGANTFTGPITVSGGTLRTAVATGTSGLGSGNITLNGSTLQLDPTASAVAGLTGRTINGAPTSNVVTQRDFNQTALDARTYFSSGNVDTTITAAAFYAGGPTDNFSVEWTGKLKVTVGGNYSFFTQSDDGSRVFIDGQLVSENDGSHGNTGGDIGGPAILLSPGFHDVRIDFTEGTGSGGEQFKWQGPGFAKTFVTSANVFAAETATTAGASNNVSLGNNISITGASTINLNGSNFTGVEVGGLSQAAGSTLNVTGLGGKLLRAASTSFSGGTATINTTPDVALGQVLDSGTAVTLVKQGSGRLILDNTAAGGRASSMLATSTIDVQAGKLVLVGAFSNSANGSTDPAGAAKIQLNGGGLVLDTKGSTVTGTGTTTFDNAVVTTQSSTVEVVPVGNGTAAAVPIPIVLGSAANGVTLANGTTLTIDLFGGSRNATALGGNFNGNQVASNGANLVVNGVISGAAGITVQSSQFNGANLPVVGNLGLTAANTYSGATTLKGMIYNAPNVLGGGLVSAGATSGAPMTLTLSGNGTLLNTSGINFNTARLTIDDSGTNLTAGAGRVADTLPITLNSSVLQFIGNATAASGETVGVLTANGGLNAVTMSGTATGVATTLTASSLARANNAQLLVQGSSLGTLATASDLLKFTTAPTATLVNGVQLIGGGAIGSTNKNVSILPFAVGTTNTTGNISWRFVGYDAANGVRPLDTTNEVEATTAATANANVRDAIAAATPITARGTAINSWILDNTAVTAQTATLTGTVSITSGALLLTATSATQSVLTLTGGTVAFGTAEGVITTMDVAGSSIGSILTGSNGLTIGGSGQTALTADNSAGLTGPITINGQLSIAADLALGNASNPVNMNGGTVKFTAATTLPATRAVTLLANTTSGFDTTTGNSVIAGLITGSGGLAKINANTLTLSNVGNNYTGRTEVYAGTLVTNSLPSGDYINNGAVTFDQNFDGTYAGSITGFGSFGKTGTGQVTLSGQNTYTGGTTVTNGSVIATSANGLSAGTSLTLGGGTTAGVVGLSFDQTFGFLTVAGSAATNAITIPSGKTISVPGTTTVGGGATITVSGGGNVIAGGDFNVGVNNNTGTFKMTSGNFTLNGGPGTNLNLGTKTTATTGTVAGALDLSGVANFTASVGKIQLAVDSANIGGTMTGTALKLATNNTITAATSIVVGDSLSDGTQSLNTIALGAGLNTITTPLLTIGGRKLGGTLTMGSGGTFNLSNGASPTDLNVGVNSATGSGTATTSIIDLSTGTFVANLNNVVIGARTGSPSGTTGGSATATVTLGTSALNNVTANFIIIGQTNASTGGTTPIGTGTGTFNMNGGNLTAGSIVLAQKVNGNAVGTLNLFGGTTTLNGDITDGGGTSTLVLNGGTLDLQGHNIGGFGAPVDTTTLAAGTLRSVGEFNGGGTLTKTTPGLLILDGLNTYTGSTSVVAGNLQVKGELSGTVGVSVAASAVLSGTGTIDAATTINGTLAPGASPGILTVNGQVTFGSGSTFALELNGPAAGTGYDRLAVGSIGGVDFGIASNVTLSLGFFATMGEVFTVVDNGGGLALGGTFANLPDHGTIDANFAGGTWTFQSNYEGGDGNDLTLTVIAVPEPGAAMALLGGLGILAALRRPRRRIA